MSTAPRSRGDLLAVDEGVGGGSAPRRWRGKKCWEVFFSRSGPCPGCPAFELAPESERTEVLDEREGPFTVVHAQRGRRSARVTAVSIPDSVLVALLHGKLRRLVDAARLSGRERDVLDLLFLGRRTRDIAATLEISLRTVKFHVTNVLRKLSATSRIDLARKVLWTADVVSSGARKGK